MMKKFGRFFIANELRKNSNSIEYLVNDSQSEFNYLLRLPNPIEENGELNNQNLSFDFIKELREEYRNPKVPRKKQIYGLIDNQYLMPVSDPFVLDNGLTIIDINEVCPAEDLHLFSAWEAIALQMMSEAHFVTSGSLSEQEWSEYWSELTGGDIIVKAIEGYLENGNLSRTEKFRIIEKISIKNNQDPDLAKNLLLRIIGGITRARIEPEKVITTLTCSHIRRNITNVERKQLAIAYKSLDRSFGDEMDKKWIELITALISVAPIDISNSPEDYIYKDEQNNLYNFHLYLETIN